MGSNITAKQAERLSPGTVASLYNSLKTMTAVMSDMPFSLEDLGLRPWIALERASRELTAKKGSSKEEKSKDSKKS